ncbi:hypothetical protein [Staphylococcus aureus]|uniref:hypothetical protein n=1 Tax=Staphylococcus aureus TaxID=1280 RepID=UPI0020C16D93|nr:hypothetical protein [Staphylococcus aureus]
MDAKTKQAVTKSIIEHKQQMNEELLRAIDILENADGKTSQAVSVLRAKYYLNQDRIKVLEAES